MAKGRMVEIWVQVGAVIPTGQFRNSQPMAGVKVALDPTEGLTMDDVRKAYAEAWGVVSEEIYDRIQEIDDAVKKAGR